MSSEGGSKYELNQTRDADTDRNRRERDAHDREILRRDARALNREARDVLGYQTSKD